MGKNKKVSKPSRGQRFEALEQEVKQLYTSIQINQMMIKQFTQGFEHMRSTLDKIASYQKEIQYKLRALQDLTNVSAEAAVAKSIEFQIKDFEEVAAKEDKEEGLIDSSVVTEDSTVTITSETESGEGGVLRSRLKMEELHLPVLKEGMLAKQVGDKVEFEIGGQKHTAEILAIKTLSPEVKKALEDKKVETKEESASE